MKERKTIFSSPFAALALVVAFAFGFSFLIYCGKSHDYAQWQPAPAVVVRWEDIKDFKTKVYFTYTVAGQQYSGTDVYHRSSEGGPPAGSQVTVWYDPENTARVSFYKPKAEFDALAPFFLAFPLCVGCIIKFFRKDD